eukprot:TRINITY_DN8216_c0_g1_i3.p1 TRINITY_DN8216_c0_g1~~TRINITY_DN8216_c0_g1_i3.p1  ORF type:complete len:306 (-),score=38.08 TRINITY_DN8216_c0_g1_i3:520-1437(-)
MNFDTFSNSVKESNEKANEIVKSDIITLEAEEVTTNNAFSWEVKEQPIFDMHGKKINGYKTVQRSDNGTILNLCKDSYTPTTNELFCTFADNLSKVTGYEINNFSEFEDGKKVLAFLQAPETFTNGHKLENYIAIGNSHDSTKAFFVAHTDFMIRCQNQFSLASKGFKAFHTTNNAQQIKTIEKGFKAWTAQHEAIQNQYKMLSNKKVDSVRAMDFFRHIFEIEANVDLDSDLTKVLSTRKINQISELMECVETEVQDLGQTEFALFNGVTRWTSHVRKQKEKSFGNLFGMNAKLNERAYNFFNN